MSKYTMNLYELEAYGYLSVNAFDGFNTIVLDKLSITIDKQYLYNLFKAVYGLREICYDVPSTWVNYLKLNNLIDLPLLRKRLELINKDINDFKFNSIINTNTDSNTTQNTTSNQTNLVNQSNDVLNNQTSVTDSTNNLTSKKWSNANISDIEQEQQQYADSLQKDSTIGNNTNTLNNETKGVNNTDSTTDLNATNTGLNQSNTTQTSENDLITMITQYDSIVRNIVFDWVNSLQQTYTYFLEVY